MSLTRAQARDEILGLFKATWDSLPAPVPPVAYDDNAPPPTKGDQAWARVTLLHNDGDQQTLGGIGNRRFNRLGVVIVQVFTPYGGGSTKADVLVPVARDAFEGKSTPGGVWFRHVREQDAGKSGQWQQTNVSAEYEYDEIK